MSEDIPQKPVSTNILGARRTSQRMINTPGLDPYGDPVEEHPLSSLSQENLFFPPAQPSSVATTSVPPIATTTTYMKKQ